MLTDLIYYDLKVAALIAVFYLFYMLLLARETTHALNRFVLLAGIALSVVLPLCIITIHEKPHPQPLSDGRGEYIELPTEQLPAFASAEETASFFQDNDVWTGLLFAFILSGIFLRLLFLMRSYMKLGRLIQGGERHTLPSGTRVSVVDVPIAPFSWMQTIVLSRADWLMQSESILAHEEAHVRYHHSYDVMVVEVLTALQWFNPVVWFLRQELRILHEYQADASVLSSGFDESQYIHLLMQKATGIQACALANGIHTPKTKKRIFMMLKTKSNRSAWLKALYIVPVVLVSLALSAETVVDHEEAATNDASAVRLFSEKVFEICEQLPQFPGGEVGLMKWLAQNIKYPTKAMEYGVQGRVLVQFIVEKDGSLSNFTIVDSPKSSGANMVVVNAHMTDKQRKDAETHNAGVKLLREEVIRVVKAMPKWTPGKQKGKVVRCKFLIPVSYRLQ